MRDVVVIGGGVTGAAVARACALSGLDVLVVDREDVGAGASDLRAELAVPIRREAASDDDALADLRALAPASVWSARLAEDGRDVWLVDSARLSVSLAVDALRAGAELALARSATAVVWERDHFAVTIEREVAPLAARAVVVAAGAESQALAPGSAARARVAETRVRFGRVPDERVHVAGEGSTELLLLPGARTLEAIARGDGTSSASDVRARAVAVQPGLASVEVVSSRIVSRLADDGPNSEPAEPGRPRVAAGLWPARAIAHAHVVARSIAVELGARASRSSSSVRFRSSPRELAVVCACAGVTERDVRRAIHVERARDLDGIRRRTGLGEGACAGTECAIRAAELLAEARGLGAAAAHRAAASLVTDRLAGRNAAFDRGVRAISRAWQARLAALGIGAPAEEDRT